MNVERQRPIKQFEVIVAYGPYRVGDIVQPTGLYRGVLLNRGVIRELKEDEPAVAKAEERAQLPGMDRMVHQGAMSNRKRGR